LRLNDEAAEPRFSGMSVTETSRRQGAAAEKIKNLAAIWTLSEGHQISVPPNPLS
jgi:hypothetical protein